MGGPEETARERLLAEVYAQPEAGARDRERAVDRFMQMRASRAPQRRTDPRRWARAAAVAVCALSAGLAWSTWRPSALDPRPAADAVQSAAPTAAPTGESRAAVETPSTPSLGQDGPQPSPLASVPPPEAASLSAPAPAPAAREEIVVRARRRDESAEPRPVAVTGFAAAEAPERAAPEREAVEAPPLPQMPREEAVAEPSLPDPKVFAPATIGLDSPITLGAPSRERLRELEGQRGNDMAEVLPPLGSESTDPCTTPERVGAAVPAEGEEPRPARCWSVER